MADQLERLGVAVGEDRDLSAVGQRRREVAQLTVDPDRQRRLCQAGPDRRRGIGAGGALGQLQRRAVGELDSDLLGRRLDPAMLPTAPGTTAARAVSAEALAGLADGYQRTGTVAGGGSVVPRARMAGRRLEPTPAKGGRPAATSATTKRTPGGGCPLPASRCRRGRRAAPRRCRAAVFVGEQLPRGEHQGRAVADVGAEAGQGRRVGGGPIGALASASSEQPAAASEVEPGHRRRSSGSTMTSAASGAPTSIALAAV